MLTEGQTVVRSDDTDGQLGYVCRHQRLLELRFEGAGAVALWEAGRAAAGSRAPSFGVTRDASISDALVLRGVPSPHCVPLPLSEEGLVRRGRPSLGPGSGT